jgi:hypothetical protein
MILYKFMQDDHWYEDVGHIFIGLIPMWGWIREHWQWPPGDTAFFGDPTKRNAEPEPWAPHDRVADAYRDFLGYAIGGTIRCAGLLGVILWILVR